MISVIHYFFLGLWRVHSSYVVRIKILPFSRMHSCAFKGNPWTAIIRFLCSDDVFLCVPDSLVGNPILKATGHNFLAGYWDFVDCSLSKIFNVDGGALCLAISYFWTMFRYINMAWEPVSTRIFWLRLSTCLASINFSSSCFLLQNQRLFVIWYSLLHVPVLSHWAWLLYWVHDSLAA